MTTSPNKSWYVTGCSSGFGFDLVILLLNNGYQVTATTRNTEKLNKKVKETVTDSKVLEGNFLAVSVDLLDEKSIKASLDSAISKFGKIDVVVNNAGYAQSGAVEEISDKEARSNFDINVFGVLNVIRQSLPLLKISAKSNPLGARIYNISSIGGREGFVACGIYCATKFAVNAFTESLRKEVASFNIHATIVSPGAFRTDFSDSSSTSAANKIEGYDIVRQSEERYKQWSGKQPGDPKKAMQILIDIANEKNPPLDLILGCGANKIAQAKLNSQQEELNKYSVIGTSTDFPSDQ